MSRLYLRQYHSARWIEAVLDTKTDIRFDFVFENIDDPAKYVSDRSVSVKLPRCAENNKMFAEFCRLDSKVVAGVSDTINKMDYKATTDSGTLISEGTATLSNVTDKEYTLSLVGTLAQCFSKISNAGWNTENEDEDYSLMTDFLKQGQAVYLDRKLIYTSWLIENPLFSLKEMELAQLEAGGLKARYGLSSDSNVSERNAFAASLIGFAPTSQGRYANFESDKYVDSFFRIKQLFGGSVDIGDGTIEAQMGEYRTIYQQPYIYVSALWQFLQRDFERITGYRLLLDYRWFNNGNSDLRSLVYMLPQLYDEGMEIKHYGHHEQAMSGLSGAAILPNNITPSPWHYDTEITGLKNQSIPLTVNVYDGWFVKSRRNEYAIDIDIVFMGLNTLQDGLKYYMSRHNGLVFTSQYGNYILFPVPDDEFLTPEDADFTPAMATLINDYAFQPIYPKYTPYADRVEIHTRIAYNLLDAPAAPLATELFFAENYIPFFTHAGTTSTYLYNDGITMTYNVNKASVDVYDYPNGGTVTLERLFRDVSPFSVLLEYGKTRNLKWVFDDTAKTVTVKTSKDYFADMSLDIDVSELIDAEGLTVTDVSPKYKAFIFNMGDIDGDGVEGYESRFGLTYGSKKVVVGGNIAKQEKKLLSGNVNTSVMYSLTYYPKKNISQGIYTEMLEDYPMPLNISDGEAEDNSGNFYYRHGNRRRKNKITDDSTQELFLGTYCWHASDMVNTDTGINVIPIFNTVSAGGLSVLFAPAREEYTSVIDNPSTYLYEKCWKNYMEAINDVQNKTIEAKMFLTATDMRRVRQNPVVRIDNLLYIVLEVKGWGEHSRVCKCKLKQIRNYNKLTN